MTATKQRKTQSTFWTAIFHDKFTLWYIKLTTYIYKNRFTSHKKYLFGLIFSENPKKSHTNQIYYKFFYSAWREATHKPSKVATAKKIFSIVFVIVTTNFDKCFHSMWQLEDIVFNKSLSIPPGLFNCHVLALFETNDLKEVRFFFYLRNKSTMLIAKWKVQKWNSRKSYLLNILYSF